MEGLQPNDMLALTMEQVRQRMAELNLSEEQRQMLDAAFDQYPADATISDIMTGVVQPNMPQIHILGHDDITMFTAAINTQSPDDIEKLQTKINALLPGEYVEIGYGTLPRVILAPYHVDNRYSHGPTRIYNVGFDVDSSVLVWEGDHQIVVAVGSGRQVTIREEDGKITPHKSVNSLIKGLKSRDAKLARCLMAEKKRKINARMEAMQTKIDSMQQMLDQLWYSPTGPGANEAKTHFESLSTNEAKTHFESLSTNEAKTHFESLPTGEKN